MPIVATLLFAGALAAALPGSLTEASLVEQPSARPAQSLAGPWGELELSPIVISPPLEFLQRNLVAPKPAQWVFPGADRAAVDATLRAAGISAEDAAHLLHTSRTYNNGEGVVLLPEPAFVLGLAPATRAALYVELSRSPLNEAQNSAFRFRAATPEDWLRGAPISDATRQTVEGLMYRSGSFLFFADFDLVRDRIADPDELQRLHKRLLRMQTFVVSVRVDEPADIDRIVEYWGRGGRRTDIRPVLESLAEGGAASIDISHLLPTLARTFLYRYPRVTLGDLSKPLLANCLWTSLNFFSPEPDDRYLDLDTAIAALETDYYFIQDNYQLGDIVVLSDSSGTIFHAAVYLAADLIFGKNGSTPLAPWSIMTIEDLEGYYAPERERGWRVSFLRRKDL